jgi:very-short-patch-repair endonuclease
MYILPEEKLELTDEIRIHILDTINGFSHKKIFEMYGKYFHCFSDILENSSFPMEEVLYILKHGRPEPCEYGNIGKFKKFKGYSKFCGNASDCKCKKVFSQKQKEIREATNLKKYGKKSTLMVDSVKEKIKKTNIGKYGVDNPFKATEVKQKIKNTVLDKYGVEYASQIPNAIEKKKKTFIEKYGVENPFMCDNIKEKSRKTCIEKYGKEYYSQTEIYKEQVKETNIEKYGVEFVLQSEEIRDKSKNTLLEKYGTDNPMKSPEILNKVMESITRNSIEKHGTKSPLQKNLTYMGKKLLNEPELFQEYLDKYTVYELQEIFGCKSSTIYEYVKQFNLTIPIRTGSSYENILSEILTENGIDHVRQDRSIISPKEIDIFIPSANLAIEINGLYWHSDKFKDKNYHYSKWKECHDKGIQLLSIMEDEFVNRSNTWISKILHICNKSKERIHARKCDIVELGKDGVYDFVEKYHLQGFALGKHYYGAYYDNELVAMMSFSNTRNNKEIQMNRFCLKNGVIISGIANRLLKAYITDYDINEIVTYSDNRYSDGGIYRQMGFEMVNTILPDYSYVKGMERLHKSGFKKSNIASKFGMDMSTKTEREAMEELGFVRIYDCGKVKWKFVKKSS